MSAKIAINGFGRIGRALARLIVSRKEYDLVAINELSDIDTSAYLFKYDSVHGQSGLEINNDKNYIYAGGRQIKYSSCKNIEDADFKGCDIVFECSGNYTTSASLKTLIYKNSKKIVIASMPKDDTPVFVIGISDKNILSNSIISAGSCSTNALSLILQAIEQNNTIEYGSVTSVHSYTADQNLLDGRNSKSLRVCRAAPLNIIPVPTGVSKNLSYVLPHIADRFMGFSVRVPVADVTMLDITVSMQKSATISEINEMFVKESLSGLKNILKVDYDSRVSSDFISNDASVTVALDLTQKISEKNFKIVAWFDNEMGYAGRLYDLISLL